MTSDTQGILGRISALRQRLEQSRMEARHEGRESPAEQAESDTPGLARLWDLERRAAEGGDHQRRLDDIVHPPESAPRTMPRQLTARARRLLENAREVIQSLHQYQSEPLVHEPGGLLTALYRDATALAEAGLRLAALLPDSATEQVKMCDGIDALVRTASGRIGSLGLAVTRMRLEEQRLSALADFLDRIDRGGQVDLQTMTALADELLYEASEVVPLRFHQPPAPRADRAWVGRLVACHSLTTAQVMARLVRLDPELRGSATECVLAALLHDVGMMRIDPALLSRKDALDDDARRALEAHCHVGAYLLARHFPGAAYLVEAADRHHERMNGIGYPDGLTGEGLSPLVRLLAVCDVYSASCAARPHRPARETRTALTDTLLLADKGRLDRRAAELLLDLSFYPAGSVVELADGSLAGVVAAQTGRKDLHAPARPVIAVLTDAQGRFLPLPRWLDLSHSDSHGIVRALDPEERRRTIGTQYPEWAL